MLHIYILQAAAESERRAAQELQRLKERDAARREAAARKLAAEEAARKERLAKAEADKLEAAKVLCGI